MRVDGGLEDEEIDGDENDGVAYKSRHAAGVLLSSVKDADVVLEVLNAMDPAGCCSREVENSVTDQNKRLVHLLYKMRRCFSPKAQTLTRLFSRLTAQMPSTLSTERPFLKVSGVGHRNFCPLFMSPTKNPRPCGITTTAANASHSRTAEG